MRTHQHHLISLLLAILCSHNLSYAQIRCGCDRCDDSVLNSLAGGVPCIERIDYLVNQENFTERDACLDVVEEVG